MRNIIYKNLEFLKWDLREKRLRKIFDKEKKKKFY